MDKINLFKDALPKAHFRRLGRAVHAVGTERMENMGSYNTTFWFPIGVNPTNIVEECISKLHALVRPGPNCIGMEWWLGRLKFGEGLAFHTDRDRSLRHQTGEIVHPLWSSILYLNRFPSSPTIVLDQVLSSDGKSWIPPVAKTGRSLDAVPNHYVAFRGDLRHGVVANERAKNITTAQFIAPLKMKVSAKGQGRAAVLPPEMYERSDHARPGRFLVLSDGGENDFRACISRFIPV